MGSKTEADSPDLTALANIRDGAPERYVPGLMAGGLIEVDHLSRYHWAAQFAAGRRVLDVACGAGYGCRLLADAGAASVTGVDRSGGLIDAIRGELPEVIRLQVGDILSLPLPDAAFDLVVCLETIEHVDRPRAALAELTRVLAPEGLVIVSTPERRVSAGNNPHHLHELTSDELQTGLAEHFGSVEIFRQEPFLCSAIVPEPGFTDEIGEAALARRLTSVPDGLAQYVIGLASRVELPPVRPLLGLTTRLDFHTWQTFLDGAAEQAKFQQQLIDELNDRLLDHEALQDRLIEVEQQPPHGLGESLEAESRGQWVARDEEVRILRERLERADRVWRDVQASPSWRLTKPLRTLKSLLKD